MTSKQAFSLNFNFVLGSVVYLSVSETWFHLTWCEWGIRSLITLKNINSHFIDAFKLYVYFDQDVEIFRYLSENRFRPPGQSQEPMGSWQSWLPAATVIMLSDEVIFLDTMKPFSFCLKGSRSKFSKQRKVWCLKVRLLVCNASVSKIVRILVRSYKFKKLTVLANI